MSFLGIDLKQEHKKVRYYMFTRQRTLYVNEAIPEKKDNGEVFYYDKQPYIIDITCVQFYTIDKKPIFFYLEGIPNPVIFNMKKNIQKFIEEKRKDPEATVMDDEGNILEFSFSSAGLQMYTKNTFLKQLLAKMTPEQLKIILALIVAFVIQSISIIIIILFKWK